MPIAILCYHGVVEQITHPVLERNFRLVSHFREGINYIYQHFPIISLPEVELAITETKEFMVAITVDDGHANNLLIQTILAEMQIPWAAFIPTNGVGNMIWTTELALLVLTGQASSIFILGQPWLTESDNQRETAYHEIRGKLKKLPAPERQNAMSLIREQISDAGELLTRYPSMQSMSWNEIAFLRNQGVIIGSHGVDHEIHHAGQYDSIQLDELQKSKFILEEKLECNCDYFALPNGDATPETSKHIQQAGYRLGFTSAGRFANSENNRYLLPRLSFEKFCRQIRQGAYNE